MDEKSLLLQRSITDIVLYLVRQVNVMWVLRDEEVVDPPSHEDVASLIRRKMHNQTSNKKQTLRRAELKQERVAGKGVQLNARVLPHTMKAVQTLQWTVRWNN
jgi:hypothetical protein